MRNMKLLRFVPYVAIGAAIYFVLSYRNEVLSVEITDNNKIYLAAKQVCDEAMARSELSYECSFIPNDLLDQNGNPKYPLKISKDGNYLTGELRTLSGTTPSVIKYFSPPHDVHVNVEVCKLNQK